jgi:NAD(P)-dependent dehydrogenase (short-subunit alcohol dehydrogenase family)
MQRVVAISGAFGALGRAVSAAAQAAGYRVAAIDITQPPAEAIGELKLGGADLSQSDQAAQVVAQVVSTLGGLDVVLNIAGGFSWSKVGDDDPEEWTRLHRLNLLTAVNLSRAALPHLRSSPAGRIVNVGALAAVKSDVGMGPYAASKSGVHRFTETLAAEVKDSALTVNAVLPSILDTPANRRDMPGADVSVWVQPADLAAVMLFLASPEASAVTGALIAVPGRV